MNSEKGYVMLDLLTALVILLMVATFLMPQTVLIIQERKNIRLAQTARMLLREQIISYRFDVNPPAVTLLEKNTTTYTIVWNEIEDQSAYRACAVWTDTRQKQQLCRYVAKI